MINLGYNARRHFEASYSGQPEVEKQQTIPERRLSSVHMLHHVPTNGLGLPEGRVALELVTRFLDTVATTLPYVNESLLVKEMQWINTPREARPSSPDIRALLNVVFAHSLSVVNEASAEVFYSRAFKLLEGESQHMSSLESRMP